MNMGQVLMLCIREMVRQKHTAMNIIIKNMRYVLKIYRGIVKKRSVKIKNLKL